VKLIKVLDEFYWNAKDLAEVILDMSEVKDTEDAASKWIENNQDTVDEWIESIE